MKKNPLSRKDGIVVQNLDGEVLIYDLTANKAFCLNETSALIWAACDGTNDVAGIGKFAAAKLNAPVNDDLVWLALEQLNKERLLERTPKSDGRFEGLSRREVVKKVGLGAMVAIPIVAGMLAPPAYASTSHCGAKNGNACSCPDNTNGNANCGTANCAGGATCICTGPISCDAKKMNCVGTCA